MVRPVRKFLGPYTKDEHLKFLTLQNEKRQNRVFASLGSDIPVRVHPEIVPKLKKKKSVKPSSDDDDDDVELEDVDEEIGTWKRLFAIVTCCNDHDCVLCH